MALQHVRCVNNQLSREEKEEEKKTHYVVHFLECSKWNETIKEMQKEENEK